eukprot:CAMPEP_0197437526 /NCGR_PEP_ID=MMETSP1175-20131217/4755_1 /TAXON_ID=1003142 /ORGANISM="Triceratium dubium, Strain CCMP147" /LENGTH=313 /DNA_ID=CAMNT_0042967077 /DNA_START=220 /DNA_END=1158 /DNA_ORIENTATION=-
MDDTINEKNGERPDRETAQNQSTSKDSCVSSTNKISPLEIDTRAEEIYDDPSSVASWSRRKAGSIRPIFFFKNRSGNNEANDDKWNKRNFTLGVVALIVTTAVSIALPLTLEAGQGSPPPAPQPMVIPPTPPTNVFVSTTSDLSSEPSYVLTFAPAPTPRPTPKTTALARQPTPDKSEHEPTETARQTELPSPAPRKYVPPRANAATMELSTNNTWKLNLAANSLRGVEQLCISPVGLQVGVVVNNEPVNTAWRRATYSKLEDMGQVSSGSCEVTTITNDTLVLFDMLHVEGCPFTFMRCNNVFQSLQCPLGW